MNDTNRTTEHASDVRYIEPDTITRKIFNPLITGLTKIGLGFKGSRMLEVRGRTSGEWRAVPVNPLALDSERYLVAPRGTTQWVRNIRVAGSARLRKGRRTEEICVAELPDVDKAPIIRAYLVEWAFEVGKFFDGVTAESTDAEIDAIAAGLPVFRITT